MRDCLTLKSSTSSSATAGNPSSASQANSSDATPRTSTQPSPTVNLSREYALAVHTTSYTEIWSKIHVVEPCDTDNVSHHPDLLSQILQPSQDQVLEVLKCARTNAFTQQASSYFTHTEQTSQRLLLLQQSIRHARSLYGPITDLVDLLPEDSDALSQSQCNWAFDVFFRFDNGGNPFPSSDTNRFQDMRLCYFELKQQVDRRLDKSRCRVRLVGHTTTSSAICLVGTVVGVTLSAIAVAAHALVALVAAPVFVSFVPSVFTKNELSHMAHLDAVARHAYVLNNDLETIDCLVAHLNTAIEGDKVLIRLGLNWGRDPHPVCEVVKQLGKNHRNVLDQLTDLEEHICLCFAAINRARKFLLEEICLHQTDAQG